MLQHRDPSRPFSCVEVTDGLLFPEGPVALPSGDVLVCELASGNIVSISPDGAKTVVATVGGAPNGLALGPDGRLWIANNGGNTWRWEADRAFPGGVAPEDYSSGSLQSVDLSSGEVEIITTTVDGHKLAGPNDLVFDAAGNLYFTDFGKRFDRTRLMGGLYYLPRGGKEATSLAFPLESPNGVAFSPGGERIYVAETTTGRLLAWDIAAPGELRPGHTLGHPSGANLVGTIPGYVHLDSIAVDSCGNIAVATVYRGVITVMRPDGGIEKTVHLPEYDSHVTNVCFGGPELRTAYVTSATLGKLFALSWPWPGLSLNFSGF